MDVLTDVLDTLELKGWLSSRRELSLPWRYEFEASPDSIFHVVYGGSAQLEVVGNHQPMTVNDGDVLLFPTGQAHALYDDQTSPLTRKVQLKYQPQRGIELVPNQGNGDPVVLLCGAFHFDYPYAFPLLRGLPNLIHIRGVNGRVNSEFAALVTLLGGESASQRPGATVVQRRLCELLFIQIIRLWIEQPSERAVGWLGALGDPLVNQALSLLHQSPHRKWTVKQLADAVALSRSAFAARFSELVGEPPRTYLTRWRMVQATRLLRHKLGIVRLPSDLGTAQKRHFARRLSGKLACHQPPIVKPLRNVSITVLHLEHLESDDSIASNLDRSTARGILESLTS